MGKRFYFNKSGKKTMPRKAKEVEEETPVNLDEPPKRAKSAYLLFTMDRRPHIVAANPEMKVTEIMKQMGAEWREIDEDEKTKCEKAAEKEKERYEAEKERFVAAGGDLNAGKKSKSKK